jgi:hypothetical protein
MLIYDGHGSHTTVGIIDLAIKHGIHLFCLPPHTTHRLQPLDVSVFGPLQIAWFNRCDEILELTGEGIEAKNVVKEYMKARNASFKSETILQAWRKAGIRPINLTIFTEADFAPSYSTSINMHAPESFPSRMPHIDDASSDDVFDPSASYEVERTGEGSENHSSDFSMGSGSGSESPCSIPQTTESDSIPRNSSTSQLAAQADRYDCPSEIPISLPGSPTRAVTPMRTSQSRAHHRLMPYTRPSSVTDTPTQNGTPSVAEHRTRSQTRQSLSLTPIETHGPRAGTAEYCRVMEGNIRVLQEKLARVQAERDAAETHAIFAQREAAVYKYCLEKRMTKQSQQTRRLHTQSRIVTSAEGRTQAIETRTIREAKEKEAADKLARKETAEAENHVRRNTQGHSIVFTGSLGTKNKTQLGDLASALALSLEGTKADFVERITKHFEENPDLKLQDRFVGIFNRSRQRRQNQPDSNEPEVPAGLDTQIDTANRYRSLE